MRMLVFALMFQCITPLVAQKRFIEFQKLSNLLSKNLDINGVKFCISGEFNDIKFKKEDLNNLFSLNLLEKDLYQSSRKIRFKNEQEIENCNCLNDSLDKWIETIEYNDSLYSDFRIKYLMRTNEILNETEETNFTVAINEAIRDSSIQFIESIYFIIEIKSLQKISKNQYYVRLSNTRIGKIPSKTFYDVLLIKNSNGELSILDIQAY